MFTWLRWLRFHALRLWRLALGWLWLCRGQARWRYPRPANPSRHYHAPPKPEWVRREIIRLKAVMPHAGCRTLAHLFNRRFAVRREMTVGKTFVADTIRRHQHAVLTARRRLKHAVPRPIPRNLIWGLDLMVKTDRHGRAHFVLAILDHASRACLRLQRVPDKATRTLLPLVLQAVKRYGRPRFLRMDNESVFTSRRFRLGLRLLGITPQRTDPGCPWQNGRVERFFGTLKAALPQEPVVEGPHLDTALCQFRTWYNHLRPHQHLHGRTPAEVWAGVDIFAPSSRGLAWAKDWTALAHRAFVGWPRGPG